MTRRSTAEIVADLRLIAGSLWTVSPDTRVHALEAADRLTELQLELDELKAKTHPTATKWRRPAAKAPHNDGGDAA